MRTALIDIQPTCRIDYLLSICFKSFLLSQIDILLQRIELFGNGVLQDCKAALLAGVIRG